MFGKINSIKMTAYFALTKPKYIFIRITPDKSIRNYDSSNIAKAITYTYRALMRRIHKEQKKFFFETNFKISYIIDIKHNEAKFYFMIPKAFTTILIEKIAEIWPKAKIEEVETIEPFSNEALTYQLSYKKEDSLSLKVDRKSNEPLNSILNVIDVMKDDDRVTIIYNFMPRTQFGWFKEYSNTMEKLKSMKPVDKEKLSLGFIAKSAAGLLVSLLDNILEIFVDFTGGKKENPISFAESLATALEINKEELSAASKRKKDLRIIDTQIAVVSHSKDETRKDNNAISVCLAYRVLDEDNELNYKRVKETPKLEDYKFNKIETNTVSIEECQNFIQIPGRTLLRQFNIPHIQTNEATIPKELQKGYVDLGEVKCKNSKIEAYLEDDYDIGSLPLVLVGGQGSGKSTFIANYCHNANARKEGILIIDYIKNCELSDAICSVIPNEDRIVLDLSKEDDIQGLGFNEIKITNNMADYDKLKFANLQAQQTMALVDAINPNAPLSSQMRTYLSAASNVVYAAGYTSIRDVVNCLDNHNKRHMYIDKLSDSIKIHLEDEINNLCSMDEIDKKTGEIEGTKPSKLEFIMDRINLLKEDFKLKYMFNKSTENNIDLVQLMEAGKVVIIKMPQNEFPTKMIKNVLITYWLSKKWLSDQIRGSMHKQPLRSHTIVDEVFQAPTSFGILEYILPQSRKFGSKMLFSTQYTGQINPILDTLKASGGSFMFLKGTSEEDFNKFKADFEEFEYEDLRDMNNDGKYRYSLNLIYYSKGYASFISKLPPPVRSLGSFFLGDIFGDQLSKMSP